MNLYNADKDNELTRFSTIILVQWVTIYRKSTVIYVMSTLLSHVLTHIKSNIPTRHITQTHLICNRCYHQTRKQKAGQITRWKETVKRACIKCKQSCCCRCWNRVKAVAILFYYHLESLGVRKMHGSDQCGRQSGLCELTSEWRIMRTQSSSRLVQSVSRV